MEDMYGKDSFKTCLQTIREDFLIYYEDENENYINQK